MKKTLLNLALVATLASISAQGVSAVAAFDDFGKVAQYSKQSDQLLWDSLTHTGNAAKKAYEGIFWWTKRTDGMGLDFTKTRTGNGKQSYVVSQPNGAYEPLGVGFGTYSEANLVDSNFFTLDLSANKTVTFTINNTSTEPLLFKVGLQDINGVLLNGYASGTTGYTLAGTGDLLSGEANDGTGAMYKYEIGVNVLNAASADVTLDFTGAAEIYYDVDPVSGCKSVAYYKLLGVDSQFDFTKVKAFTLTPVSATGIGTGNAGDCYRQDDLVGGSFDISNFKIGDVSTILGVSDETITAFNNEVVSVYNFSGDFITKGNVSDLNLTPGFYILRSATKAVKINVR